MNHILYGSYSSRAQDSHLSSGKAVE